MKSLVPILFVFLISTSFSTNALRILGLFPLNGRSHWSTGERLLTGLAERGHKVDAVTHFTVKNPPPNYTEISLEGSLEQSVNNMNASQIADVTRTDPKHLVYIAGDRICHLLGHPKLQELIKNPPKDPPYDLVIVEMFLMHCYMAFGRHLNVPVVGVIASSFHQWLSDATGNPVNPSYQPFLISPFDQRMTFWERLLNTYITKRLSWQLNYYMNEQSKFVKEHFGIDAPISDFFKDMALLLINSHHSMNGITPLTQGTIEIGGLHINEKGQSLPADIQKWLDESKDGCIFVTFGSMARIETFPDTLIRTFYKVFEKIAPVRVMMKIAKKEDLLPGVPKNVLIKPWFPQQAVLKHKNVKAFITHGGLLSTQEAVYFGVPLIGIPLFGDQPSNLKKAANKNIAVNLGSFNNVTEENLFNAINTVLHGDTHRTNMKKLSTLFKERPMTALDTAVYWVEYVGRHGKVLQSPAICLNWFQRNLLDVYGFVVSCLALVLYVIYFIFKKLKNRFCGSCKTDEKASKSKKNK